MRNYWKIGCNWGKGSPDFYELLKKKSIVIYADKRNMQIGDIVAITKGYRVVAMAEITGEKMPVTNFAELEKDFNSLKIDYDSWVFIANCKLYELKPSEIFEYPLQQGFGNIHDNEIINKLNAIYSNYIKEQKMNETIELLKSNHNLILTGAPGTGKTYLAKQIAQAMGCTDNEIGFVQFHPSYDYTDFVEGLRPIDKGDGNVGFELMDGVFKEFCKKALDNLLKSQKESKDLSQEYSVEKMYEQLLSKIESEEIDSIPLKTEGKKLLIEKVSDLKNIILKAPNSTSPNTYTVSLKRILKLSKRYSNKESLDNISNISEEIRNTIGGCNASAYWAVLHLMYEQNPNDQSKTHSASEVEEPNTVEKKNYVFIIDEINRGEVSKIFGELFYSIEPGYRIDVADLCKLEKSVTIQTQYANLQKQKNEPNDFDEALEITDEKNYGHFFIPENVYIIGTMNDIDRSVESMDFAFRRRFAFVEVKADENTGMLDGKAWKDDAIKRMNSLNAAIEKIEGLSSAYHIGASYFLKLDNYNGDFGQLWKYHLDGLLREYLRGMPKETVEKEMIKFEMAYNLKSAADDSSQDHG